MYEFISLVFVVAVGFILFERLEKRRNRQMSHDGDRMKDLEKNLDQYFDLEDKEWEK